jgi:hypothetical protein
VFVGDFNCLYINFIFSSLQSYKVGIIPILRGGKDTDGLSNLPKVTQSAMRAQIRIHAAEKD